MGDILTHKALLTLNAVYKDGSVLCQDEVLRSDVALRETASPAFRVLILRMVVPTRKAEDIAEAVGRGETNIYIENIPSRMD